MEHRTIIFAGRVSSGKSSIINALCGGFVSNVSLLRETFNPIYYQIGLNGGDSQIKKIGDDLLKDRVGNDVKEKIEELKEEEISTIKRKCDSKKR